MLVQWLLGDQLLQRVNYLTICVIHYFTTLNLLMGFTAFTGCWSWEKKQPVKSTNQAKIRSWKFWKVTQVWRNINLAECAPCTLRDGSLPLYYALAERTIQWHFLNRDDAFIPHGHDPSCCRDYRSLWRAVQTAFFVRLVSGKAACQSAGAYNENERLSKKNSCLPALLICLMRQTPTRAGSKYTEKVCSFRQKNSFKCDVWRTEKRQGRW